MIKGTKDYLEDIAKHYVCAEHKTPVVVAWHSGENCYVLRCGENHYPEEVTRNPSYSELNRQGQLPDGPIRDNIERRERRKAAVSRPGPADHSLALAPTKDLGNGNAITQETLQALVSYARIYDLDLNRGHVVLYYGAPYIGLDGYLYHANRSGVRYSLNSRPLSQGERVDYQVETGDHAWLSEVVKLDTGEKFSGIGIVTNKELTEPSKNTPEVKRYPVVAAHPWQLAQKRAEWQAMRRAFPIGKAEDQSNEARD